MVPMLSVTRVIDAPAHEVYRVIADYRGGHPRILPRPPFVSLEVEEGGVGAGTRIRVEMEMMHRRESFRAVVSEPVPGKTLVETNDTGYVTTFTVEPTEDGRTSVTISTEAERKGPLAALGRWALSRLLRSVYERELGLLEEVSRGSRS